MIGLLYVPVKTCLPVYKASKSNYVELYIIIGHYNQHYKTFINYEKLR